MIKEKNQTESIQIDSPWLKEFGLEVPEVVERVGLKMSFSCGSLIYQVGDAVSHLYYLLEGRVKVFINNDLGDEKTISVVEPGNFLGEAAFLDDNARFASAVATVDCQVLALDQNKLNLVFQESPEAVHMMFRSLCRKMRLLTMQVEDLSFWSTEKRLCRFLLKLLGDFSMQTEKGLALSIILTDDQLGQHIGARREAVTKALSKLRSLGLVYKEKKRLHFPDLSLFKDYI